MHIPSVTFCMDIALKTGSTRGGENIEKKMGSIDSNNIYIPEISTKN